MRIRIWITLCLLLAGSCSRQEEPGTKGGPLTVTIGTLPGIGIDSRTALGDDGFSVRWVKGDRIALWALNNAGVAQLSAAPFTLYSFNETFQSAKFTGTIDPMPDAFYTYCALSPIPASTEGTKGVYSIPAVQDGAFNPDYDVMAATPVTGEGLVSGDNSDAVSLAFSHKVHLIKIRIPENRLGEPVTGLRLTFPVPVAGTLKVDATDPDAAPELTDGSNTLTLEFPAPVDAGAVVYAMIAPAAVDATVPVSLTAICERGESKTIRIPGKDFAAGHSTPIAFTIPEIEKIYTKIRFSIDGTGEETLGEKIERFTVTGPEGSDLGNGANSRTFAVDGAGKYEIVFKNEIPAGISGAAFTVAYESESAVVSNAFVMPELIPETQNTIPAFNVPYLFTEDFNRVSTFSFHDNAQTGGASIDGNTDGISLEQHQLPGWSAARVGGEAGKCIRICCRTEHGAIYATRYHGRADSPALTGIKSGKSVKIDVSFNYGGGYNGHDFGAKVAYGYTTSQGPIGSDTGGEWHITGATEFTPYSHNGSFSSTPDGKSYQLGNVTGDYRLSWEIQTTGNKWTKNGNHWLYLDNIVVSIAK